LNISSHAADAPALIVADGGVVSYGELYARSQRVAALLHDAGLRRGDGVAMVLPNRPEFLEITWGCQLSGLYYSAINTHFTADEVAYVIDDSEAKAVFVDVGGEVRVRVGGERSYEDALAAAGDPPPVSDGSEMLYSSGTTGRPKAVRRQLSTDGDGSWAQKVLETALRRRYGMTEASVYLSPAPLYHAAGVNYTMAVNRVGAASILMSRFDAEDTLRLIETHRVTHAQFVPTMFVRMLKLPEAVRRSYDVSSLTCVIHAAAPCPVDVKHQMMRWFGPIIHEYYGGTEGFPTSGWPIPVRSASRSAPCTSSAMTVKNSASGSPVSSTSRAGPTSSTSRTPARPRRSPTRADGGRLGIWATATTTATCT
jgi:acyl-CoA synthetase (AMP-forming)/AMP-acid ligase II